LYCSGQTKSLPYLLDARAHNQSRSYSRRTKISRYFLSLDLNAANRSTSKKRHITDNRHKQAKSGSLRISKLALEVYRHESISTKHPGIFRYIIRSHALSSLSQLLSLSLRFAVPFVLDFSIISKIIQIETISPDVIFWHAIRTVMARGSCC